MTDGALFSTFLIVFREMLEASLVVGIILTVLARLKETRYFPHVFASSAAAIAASFLAGACLMLLAKHFRHEIQELMEGLIAIAACGVLTYMIFWMEAQSRKIRPEIEFQVEQVLSQKELVLIMSLPFLAVLREGAETVLFLFAVANQEGGAISLSGGLAGFFLAIGIVSLIFVGGKKVPLRPLFQASGFLLLFMAAGMLTSGIHELEELGWLPEIKKNVWNLNPVLNEKKGIGLFLKSLFGYNGNPSLLEIIAYVSYLTGIFVSLKKQKVQLQPVQ